MSEVIASVAANALWWVLSLLIVGLAGFLVARQRVWPVRIVVTRMDGPDLARTRPEILIATFSGYRCPKGMDEGVFLDALRRGDLSALPLSEATPSIGQTVRVIKTYPTLREVYLITTRSENPAGASIESVPLLKAYMRKVLDLRCEIVAREDYSVPLGEDSQVLNATFGVTKAVFESLREYQPEKILVDVTGGLRAMSVGALLACLRPDQNVHLIGSRYTPTGDILDSFPMVIRFKPSPPWARWGSRG